MRAFTSALLVTATVALGCASGSRSATVGAAAGSQGATVGATAGTQGTGSGERNGPVGLCMFDRSQGDVRHCMHYAFGRCSVFGDPCEEDEINAQREAETARRAKERAAK
jgi:hypothetical protein